MVDDLALFYYYSMPSFPEGCFLGLSSEIAYRNMFLFRITGENIHFEFPMFEDHSYNSICNGDGVKKLFRRPKENKKYILFRTKDLDTNKCNIVGFYKIGRLYYQETRLFNDNGIVYGLESESTHLIKKGLDCTFLKLKQGIRYSWTNKDWEEILNDFLEKIKKQKNMSDMYQSDTNKLIELFQNPDKIQEWKENCQLCDLKNKCTFLRRNQVHERNFQDSDLFSVIHNVYRSNLYSRNYLAERKKIYLR